MNKSLEEMRDQPRELSEGFDLEKWSIDLDSYFFEHANDDLKPPELCRNGRPKIVYFKSEVERVIQQMNSQLAWAKQNAAHAIANEKIWREKFEELERSTASKILIDRDRQLEEMKAQLNLANLHWTTYRDTSKAKESLIGRLIEEKDFLAKQLAEANKRIAELEAELKETVELKLYSRRKLESDLVEAKKRISELEAELKESLELALKIKEKLK